MSEELEGNCLVAQSGGPTSVINASLAGVVTEALNYECIEEIYGGLNGVLGILNEQIIDLAAESQQNIRGLRYTPGAALGTCRYKLRQQSDFDRVLQVFEAHNIRYFFYAGGNDSQDTADKISKLAQERGYELRVIGIPKTIDNDLVTTDHTPGYGSVIKYIASTVKEIACDNAAMGQHDLVQIIEVMGRSAGWIAAGAALAKRRDDPNAAPHLIYLPEVAFSKRSSSPMCSMSSRRRNTVSSSSAKVSSTWMATTCLRTVLVLMRSDTLSLVALVNTFASSQKMVFK